MLLCSVAAAMANPPVPVEKVKGTIKTPNGEPVIGATIIEKGTTNGTITDVNGNFVLKIMNKIGELEAACVGFKKVVFKPEKEIVSLIMEEDTKVLGEVVVTALGITREAKSLGYSVQKLGGDGVVQAHESNFVNALSNRIAGVQITNSSGGIGASSSIQIRGQNFVGGYNYNNSPLFVVDGVPISNNNEQSTRSFTGRQDYNNPNFTSGEAEVDYGNAAGEINQEDILISTPKKEDVAPVILRGRVDYFNEAKGFGFIRDLSGTEKYFFHVNNVVTDVREGNVVTFDLERGAKGMNAVNICLER